MKLKTSPGLIFGYGETVDENGDLQLVHHPDNVFVRFEMDSRQFPRKISFLKKKQCMELRPELLTTVRRERRAIREDVKRSCVKLAQKYLSQPAIRFYESLPSSTVKKMKAVNYSKGILIAFFFACYHFECRFL